MYEYLRLRVNQDVDVEMRLKTARGLTLIIQGVLYSVAEDCLVVRHASQGDYVVPFASVNFINAKPAGGEE